jgi:hypothetical protein
VRVINILESILEKYMEQANIRAAWICLTLLLSGCSSVSIDKVWPFGENSSAARSGAPVNATEYQCDGGKHFYLRTVDNGNAAWLIYPDREVNLSKDGNRYSNGIAVLEISDGVASLKDGPAIAYSGCKAAVAAK